jgi:hypothetical protein
MFRRRTRRRKKRNRTSRSLENPKEDELQGRGGNGTEQGGESEGGNSETENPFSAIHIGESTKGDEAHGRGEEIGRGDPGQDDGIYTGKA